MAAQRSASQRCSRGRSQASRTVAVRAAKLRAKDGVSTGSGVAPPVSRGAGATAPARVPKVDGGVVVRGVSVHATPRTVSTTAATNKPRRGTVSSSSHVIVAPRCSLDDPFAILEVPRDASDADIKRAYRRLAKDHHPDRHPNDPDAAARFKRIAAAFDVLSDSKRRAEWLQENGSGGATWPSSFTVAVENAVARAQLYIEAHVLPHYVRHWRGAGAEAAVRLWQDAESLVDGGFLAARGEPPGPLARRRAQWWARRIAVSIEDWPMVQASHRVRLRNGRHRIVVLPFALWQGGIRESSDVDDLVLRILVARYAQVWADPSGALAMASGPDAIARAKTIDEVEVRRQRISSATTVGLVLVVTLLVYSGLAGW